MAYQSYVTNGKKCGSGQLKVSRRGYTTKQGTKVQPTTFCATDRGRPGRGPKVIPTPRKGALGGPGYTSKSAAARRRLLNKHLREHGYSSTISALQSRINLGQRTMSAAALKVFEADKRWLQKTHATKDRTKNMAKTKTKNKTAPKKRNAKKGMPRKATAVRKAMTLGVSKEMANKLWDEGKLTPTGKPKKGARGIPATMRAALKKTSKKSSKKAPKKASKKAGRKAPKRRAKKTAKRKTKKRASKATPKTQRTGARRRGGACYKLGGKKTPKKASAAARRVQKGEKGRSGRVLAYRGYCRNFNDLSVPESELGNY